ncbi:hypothetical protein [Lyngbya aestuarii]|uniref:hypothetical protein n=1 Tax=Lyngbya aestuarii TaxID=118322 RepID=UPI00403D69BD
MNIITVTSTANSGTGSLREAVASAQDGDTIKFDSSLANKTITLTSGQLEINPGKNLIIDGEDAAGLTISGNNTSRVIYLNSNQDFPTNLTVKNLTIANGYTNERGAGISTTHQGELNIDNVEFKNNVADKGGGAIFSAYEGTLAVTDSKFDGNKAIAGNDERGAGAIAFWGPKEFTVTNSEFTNNEGINGAAINSLNGKLTIENSKFIDNSTTAAVYDTGESNPFLRGYGGAIYADRASTGSDETSGTIRISNSIFEGNQGRGEGGAAYLYTGTQDNVIIENSAFENNQVSALPNGGNAGNGGAVVQMNNGLNKGFSILNSTFANNTAANQGGALWAMDADTQITNSTFSGNETQGTTGSSIGGAMALYGPTDIKDSTIANNYAGWVGGGVSASNSADVTIEDTIFDNNTSGNPWGILQHSSGNIDDLGGNFQYLPKSTNLFNDKNVTDSIETTVDPQLGPLQDNGGLVKTHAIGNEVVGSAGANLLMDNLGSAGGDNGDNSQTDNLGGVAGDNGDNSAEPLPSDSNDNPFSITLTPNSTLTTSEDGDTASFTVVLNSQPVHPVGLILNSDASNEGIVDQAFLLFDQNNWDNPQEFTVTGVDDNLADGEHSYQILTYTISADSNYNNLDVADIVLTNLDNDMTELASFGAMSKESQGVGLMESNGFAMEDVLTGTNSSFNDASFPTNFEIV